MINSQTSTDDLLADVITEMTGRAKEGFLLELDFEELWSVFAQLQLALSHPRNVGPSTENARAVALKMERKLATSPGLAELARRGWIREFDVPGTMAQLKIQPAEGRPH